MAFSTVTVTGKVQYEDGTPCAGTVKFSVDYPIHNGETTQSDDVTYTLNAAGNLPEATNEVQTVTITGTPGGGNFTLTYAGQTTANIAYNANAAAVQSALEALSNIEVGDVAVTGTNPAFTVTFKGTKAGANIAEMTASGAGLTGGSTPGVTVATSTGGVAVATVKALNDPGTYPDLSAGYLVTVTVGSYVYKLRRYARKGQTLELGTIIVPTPRQKAIGAQTVIKAGALTTTDLPYQGQWGIDTSNNRIYVNTTGSAVKYAALT